ncbi:hypothetical protein U9M48_016480 [Paspalum notatum var. saurae]|uniref:Amidohydrolase 3 domain-containing protein n=1 Tax=Paspalum notatum var. saurae TaxID=547442 RepID=A0AAQ3T9B1_PASNO
MPLAAHSALLAAAVAIVAAVSLLVPPPFRFSFPWTPRDHRFADMVLTSATIYTADPARPFADAMAVRDGRVLRIGTYQSVKELKGRHTRELNLSGNVVLPGFIDSHVHFIEGGLQLARVPLRGVRSKDDFIARVKEAVTVISQLNKSGSSLRVMLFLVLAFAKALYQYFLDLLSEQISILGSGFSEEVGTTMFGEVTSLLLLGWMIYHLKILYVWLSRMDGHMGVANSLAMKIAGIDKNTNDPIGGTIMRTTKGEPTGLLVDTAMKLIFDVIQKVSNRERKEALLRASRHALMRGVTTVVDVGSYFPGVSDEKTWQDFSGIL